MKKVDANRLWEITGAEFNHKTAMALRDLFALGCFLHMKGEKEAGRKACNVALNAIGENNRKTYFSNIISTLNGNERLYALQVSPDRDIKKLFGPDDDLG